MKNAICVIILLLNLTFVSAQITFPSNLPPDNSTANLAIINANIQVSPTQFIENGSLIIENGKIRNIGQSVNIPIGIQIIDAKGKFIYPSFVEMISDYGIKKERKEKKHHSFYHYQVNTDKRGAYIWNDALKPEYEAHKNFNPNSEQAKNLLSKGIGVTLSQSKDGISRGSGVVVDLGDESAHQSILKEKAAHCFSFSKGTATTSYPTSLMGGIALLRQTEMDADWYKNYGHKIERNISLQAWNDLQSLPQIFSVGNRLEILRVAKLGKEFNKTFIVQGIGDEYMRVDELKKSNVSLIIPMELPKPYDISNTYEARYVDWSDMAHWEMAPKNPAILADKNIKFAFTTENLKDANSIFENLNTFLNHGLNKETALAALTTVPAEMLKISDQVGTIEIGKLANFFITDKSIFDSPKILDNYVRGKRFLINEDSNSLTDGTYNIVWNKTTYPLEVKNGKGTISIDSNTINSSISLSKNNLLSINFEAEEQISLSGYWDGSKAAGSGLNINGTMKPWSMKLVSKEDSEKRKEEEKDSKPEIISNIKYPFIGYGWSEEPKQEVYHIKNTTVWTNEKEGILKNTDVLIKDGKISKIGKNLNSPNGSNVIDGTDMHLTAGIIDEHSHIAISRGVNECSESSTAEVRIGDVINSEDINIYRQLAGGVTTAHLLHGSCNPIGGQSAIIKLRWGSSPEEMVFENADGFIKFALGENPKRSRASNNNRFPNTRMGVEQVFVDNFTRAREYLAEKKLNKPDFRRNLDLETVGQILENKRHISCHSYVQSEINMLMKVGEELGFNVNTFTHILEGYKVADKMAAHGAGGSTFSDWWAYKYEVYEAIPYNAALMHENGVLTAINSDDAEMARRLNQEAGKIMLFGEVDEQEAWKMVTLNPAKLLHIDDKVGSISVGKHADIVLWNDYPMNIYARAEKTFVDGKLLFDRTQNELKRKEILSERKQLINKMIQAKNGGKKTNKIKPKHHHLYHCDDSEDEMH